MAFTYKDYEESEAVRKAMEALQNHQGLKPGDYQQSETLKKYYEQLQNHQNQKPGDYQSKWQGQIDSIFDQIQNRPDFRYDVNADALYQQYKDKYTQNAQLAMENTMGQAAAMTGGYGNSYAQNVGQQAYQSQMQGLNDVIPQLYQMALDKYTRDGQQLQNQYGMLLDREGQDYGRYLDGFNRWTAERDFLTGQYNAERDYDYGRYQDSLNRWTQERDFLNGQYNAERDYDYGKYMGDRDFAHQLDRDAEDDRRWQLNWDLMNSGSSGGGSSGGGSSGGSSGGRGRSGSGNGSAGGNTSVYDDLENRLQKQGMNSREMLELMSAAQKGGGISKDQRNELLSKYQKPKMQSEKKKPSSKYSQIKK